MGSDLILQEALLHLQELLCLSEPVLVLRPLGLIWEKKDSEFSDEDKKESDLAHMWLRRNSSMRSKFLFDRMLLFLLSAQAPERTEL